MDQFLWTKGKRKGGGFQLDKIDRTARSSPAADAREGIQCNEMEGGDVVCDGRNIELPLRCGGGDTRSRINFFSLTSPKAIVGGMRPGGETGGSGLDIPSRGG